MSGVAGGTGAGPGGPGGRGSVAVEDVRLDRGGGVELAGSAWVPAGARRGLVMHPGSGPSDRHNDTFFVPIRDALLERGVAVTSFDKRGVGGSTGDWCEAGIAEQAEDAAAAVRWLRERLGGGPVGLFGHSQGGWVVLEAAARCPADLVVTSSGPAVTPNQQEVHATAGIARRAGADATGVVEAVALVGRVLGDCVAGASLADLEASLARDESLAERVAALRSAGAFLPADPGRWALTARIGAHDPVPSLRRLDVPLLALFGTRDAAVPVPESVLVLDRSVTARLLTVRLVAGDHRLQRDGAAGPDVLSALTDFVERDGRAVPDGGDRVAGPVGTVVLVEGVSDRAAVEALAARRGLDLTARGVRVLAMGGATHVAAHLRVLGRHGPGLRVLGLCDREEERFFRGDPGVGARRSPGARGLTGEEVFVCAADLEDELVRAHTPAGVEAVLEREGDLERFRTFQQQPHQRTRSHPQQLRRFLGTTSGRKERYAGILAETLDAGQVPPPLRALLARL